MAQIDFDHWCNLARTRPELYFREREQVIGRFIDSHPPAQAARLWDLQLKIDGARAIAGSPLRATRLMITMMEDNLGALHANFLILQHETEAVARLIRRVRSIN